MTGTVVAAKEINSSIQIKNEQQENADTTIWRKPLDLLSKAAWTTGTVLKTTAVVGTTVGALFVPCKLGLFSASSMWALSTVPTIHNFFTGLDTSLTSMLPSSVKENHPVLANLFGKLPVMLSYSAAIAAISVIVTALQPAVMIMATPYIGAGMAGCITGAVPVITNLAVTIEPCSQYIPIVLAAWSTTYSLATCLNDIKYILVGTPNTSSSSQSNQHIGDEAATVIINA